MKKESQDAYLRGVSQLIKEEAQKGKCVLKVQKNDMHIDILIKELESAGYMLRSAIDSPILFIHWG
jgi:hypothetical protein